jgi:hypothetical protein
MPLKRAEKLVAAIQAYIDKLREEDRKVCEEAEIRFSDPFADTVVKTVDKESDFHPAEVVLTYDGAGYDYLSLNADYPTVADKHREAIRVIAKKKKYHMEDYASWATCFYYEG